MGLYDFDVDEPQTASSWPAPAPDGPGLLARAGATLEASRRAAAYGSEYVATSDAIDSRNALLKGATGVELKNPIGNGYQGEAVQRYADLNGGQFPDLDNADQAGVVASYRMDAYQKAVQDLSEQHPGVIGGGPGGIGAPIEDVARSLANRAEQDSAAAQAGTGGFWGSLPLSLAGGTAGFLRDPVNLATSLIPVGGELRAASTVGRVVEGALESSAFNAGLAALQEPAVQQWQAKRGQETGLLPGAKDVGAAALFGLPFGVLHGVLSHGPRASGADAAAAVAGDAEAAGRLAGALPPAVAPELHAAVAADAADKAVMTDVPPGVRSDQAASAVRDAVRFGEDPDAPLPPLPPVLPEGTTDALARERLDTIEPGMHMMDALRGDPAAIASALSSSRWDLRYLGNLATLSDEAAQAVRDGALRPEYAQHIATMVSDPAEHLNVLQAVAAQAPRTESEARVAITAEIQNRTVADATAAVLGQQQVAQLAQARARPPQPQSLFAFLKAAGGVRDDGGDLRSRDYHRQFIGLINKDGMTLDQAREMAAEAGYLGADTTRALAETTPNDLLEAIDQHPVYSVFDEDRVARRGQRAAGREHAARALEMYDVARQDVREQLLAHGGRPDPVFEHEVAEYMVLHGGDIDDAIEHVARRMEPEARADTGWQDEIPFDDVPGEGRPLPDDGVEGDGGEPAAGPGAAGEPVRPGGDAGAEKGTGGKPDLFDLVPLADREDGSDLRLVRPEDIQKDEEPLSAPARQAGADDGRAAQAANDDPALRVKNRYTGQSAEALDRASLADMLARHDVIGDRTADPMAQATHLTIGRALSQRIGDTPVFTVDRVTMRRMQEMFPGDRAAPDAGGLYVPWDNHILVLDSELRDPEQASRILLHEGLHGAYYRALEHDDTTRDVVGHLRDLAEQAQVAGGGKREDLYGLTNAHEFVSEAFSNPEFQRFLAGIQASDELVKTIGLDLPGKRSLWDVFIGGLRKLLGLGADQHTLLDALTQVLSLVDEERFPDAQPGARETPLAAPASPPANAAVVAERKRRQSLAAVSAKAIATDVRGYRGPDGKPDIVSAIGRLFENVGHTGYISVRGRYNALLGSVLSDMGDALHTFARNPVTLQRANRMVLDDVARAAFGEAADPKAKAFYDAWLKPNERLREQFNAAGGAIAWRENWGLPQSHDAGAVLRAGFEAWQAFIEPRLDWARMVHPGSDAPIGAGEHGAVLKHVWQSIVMDGWNTRDPSAQAIGSSLANSRTDARFLTFKSADAWLGYNRQFGTGNVFDSMMGHTNGLARDVAAMQRLGPNPGATVQWLKQIVQQEGARHLAGEPSTFKPGLIAKLGSRVSDGAIPKSILSGQNLVDGLYDMARGSGTPHSLYDDVFTQFRNLETSAKLGSAVALHATVNPVLLATSLAHFGLPVSRMVGDIAKSFAGASAREVDAAGMILGDAMHSLEAGARQAGAMNRAAKWSEWLPTATLHYSGLEGGVQALRRSWWWGASAGVAAELDKPWDFINPRLRKNLLEGFGLNEADWGRMQQAQRYQPAGSQAPFLRWQDIRDAGGGDPAAEETALKYLGMLHSAMEFAVPSSRWRSNVALQAGTRPGTIARSAIQSFSMFKGFIGSATVSYLEALRHELAGSKATGAAAAGAVAIALTATGTLALQLKALSTGKDLMSMDPTTPEGRATLEHGFLTSGALGIFGDYLTADQSSYGHSFLSTLAGPMVTGAADTAGALKGLMHGEGRPSAAAAVKLLRNNTPVLSTHWALRAAYNRILLDQLQYLVDPKAHQSMRQIEQRVGKETGQQFWWRPGDAAPSRFPQIAQGR